jgi:hypothetical protein
MDYTVVVSGDAVFGTFATYQLAEQFAKRSGFVDYSVSQLLNPDEIEAQLEMDADFALAD